MAHIVMQAEEMQRALVRIAHEILERNQGAKGLVLAGIRRRGVPLAKRIAEAIAAVEGKEPPLCELDITLYRDDLSEAYDMPHVGPSIIPSTITGRTLVMVDDVLYTGRTARAAMDALIANGRPKRIQLAVLIDRGHRELPIRADFVGKNLPTSQDEQVRVCLKEYCGWEQVTILQHN